MEIATRDVWADLNDVSPDVGSRHAQTLVAVKGQPVLPIYREHVPDDAVVASQREYDQQFGLLAQEQPAEVRTDAPVPETDANPSAPEVQTPDAPEETSVTPKRKTAAKKD